MEIYKLPYKILIKNSLRPMLFFLLAAAVTNSIYTADFRRIVFRLIIGLIIFGLVFFANIVLLAIFDKRKKHTLEKTGAKVFFTGWLFSFLIFLSAHIILNNLVANGLDLKISPTELEEFYKLSLWRRMFQILFVSLVIYTFVFLIQYFTLQQIEKNRIEKELLELKAINAETSNQLLKQQIQPHFLFNALNTLKTLIKNDSNTAEKYLLRLSNFLRTSITENTADLASLTDELKLCEDYMEMQKVRFETAIDYQVILINKENILNKKLPFFSLQSLLENAIKHNELTEENPLVIRITNLDDEIVISNTLRPKITMEPSTGYGLFNLQERYRILSNHKVIISEDESNFSVRLKLL